jgi:hypothetical protein
MQITIKATGEVLTSAAQNTAGKEDEIQVQTGMIGPAVEAIAEAIMVEFVRKSLASGYKPLALKNIEVTFLDPEKLEPARFKDRLTKDFLGIWIPGWGS